MTALWFDAPDRGRPGVGQAARLPGAARGERPARPARRVLPPAAARARRPAALPVAAPRTPTGRTTRPAASGSARPRRSGARSPAATPARTSARSSPAAGRSACSATPSSTRARSGSASPTRVVQRLGEVLWVVDLNRQSLDRIVPDIAIGRWQGMFAAAGWQVLEVKYGRRLQELFARDGRRGAARSASTGWATRSTSGCCALPLERAAGAAGRRRRRSSARPAGDLSDAERRTRCCATSAGTT